MDNILFDVDAYEVQIEKLNNEYDCLQDIYEEFLREVIANSDKIDNFKIKANEIKEELLRIQEKILSLKKKADKIKALYIDVEELNLHLVDGLPSAAEALANTVNSEGRGPAINNNYRVVSDGTAYTVNKKYDFEDWLVEWLNTSGDR